MKKNVPLILAVLLTTGSLISIYLDAMLIFMGSFFILFSIAKLTDLKGFKNAFSKYDLIAKRHSFYAWSYPFVELFLGICFLFNVFVIPASIVTIFVMGFGSIGVARAINKKIQCACLGTKIGVPLTYVTLFEDILMMAMALIILF